MAEEFEHKLTEDCDPNPVPLDQELAPDTEPSDSEPDQDTARRPGAELFEWLQMLMVCILAAVILFNCFARLTRVDGHSMDNTLKDGELTLVWSLGYQPEQGDIVVINKKSTDFFHNRALVKRIIATGGQSVDIDYASGLVYVDGVPLDEPYIKEEMFRPGDPLMQQTHWEVPEDCVFVLGDNRNGSTDSRHAELGTIHQDYILGKVVFALWPPSKFGPM
ncbi:MAG: signal peptidase I [Lawsonibacter sp.]